MNHLPGPSFDHIIRMTDGRGTFEHAKFTAPRKEHGYCTDDMARVLVVAVREPSPPLQVSDLVRISLSFLSDAQGTDGSYRNRMSRTGRWEDSSSLDDCWGRSIWGLGTAVAHCDDEQVRGSAIEEFGRAARRRSGSRRAMAYATLGAAEVLSVAPGHQVARDLLIHSASRMAEDKPAAASPWPEPRLAYANAVLPEAMIAAGSALDEPALLRAGLSLLGWLLEQETMDGHLSVTPAGGAAVGSARPGYDQQPIEVAAIAEACARASLVDDDRCWLDGLATAAAWFAGDNDGQVVMWDPATCGGYDGLGPTTANLNEGTESTLALLATMQHARRLVTTQ